MHPDAASGDRRERRPQATGRPVSGRARDARFLPRVSGTGRPPFQGARSPSACGRTWSEPGRTTRTASSLGCSGRRMGRLLGYYSALGQLDGSRRGFITQSSQRVREFFELYKSSPEFQDGGRTKIRESPFLELLRELPLDPEGGVAFPGGAGGLDGRERRDRRQQAGAQDPQEGRAGRGGRDSGPAGQDQVPDRERTAISSRQVPRGVAPGAAQEAADGLGHRIELRAGIRPLRDSLPLLRDPYWPAIATPAELPCVRPKPGVRRGRPSQPPARAVSLSRRNPLHRATRGPIVRGRCGRLVRFNVPEAFQRQGGCGGQ